MTHTKNDDEYFRVTTAIRLDTKTDGELRTTAKTLNISLSAFIRNAIRDAIANAGVIK